MANFITGIDINTLAKVTKTFLGFFCHQDKSILLSIYGDYLQLCPRCIGLHSGFFITIVASLFIYRDPRLTRKKILNILLVLLVTLTGFHWLGGAIDMFDPSSFTRLCTGLISGSAFGYLIYFYHTLNKMTFIRSSWPVLIILLITIIFFITALIFKGSVFLNYSLGLIVIFNILTLLKALVSIFQRTTKYQPQLNKMEVLK
jgi:uncharacterized membrane protein